MIIRVSVEDIKNKIKELIYIKENEPENALIVGRRIRNWATLSKYWTYTYRNQLNLIQNILLNLLQYLHHPLSQNILYF